MTHLTFIITTVPPSPMLVLSDQIYDANNSHEVNISWPKATNVQQATYEVHVSSAIQGVISTIVTHQWYIMLQLTAHMVYDVTVRTITCDGHLNSTESHPLTIELNGMLSLHFTMFLYVATSANKFCNQTTTSSTRGPACEM